MSTKLIRWMISAVLVSAGAYADDNTATLQDAVNAFATLRLPAECGTYQTDLSSGAPSIVQNLCRVGGTWADADLSLVLSPDQLQAAIHNAGGSPADLLSSDPMTHQIGDTVSVPTDFVYNQRPLPDPNAEPVSPIIQTTQATPPAPPVPVTGGYSGGYSAPGIGVNGAISLGGTVAAIALSLFGAGNATERTQMANNAQLATQQALQAKMYADMMIHSRNAGTMAITNLPGELATLQGLIKTGHAIGYGNSGAPGQMQSVYPGYGYSPASYNSMSGLQIKTAMDTLSAVTTHSVMASQQALADAQTLAMLRTRNQEATSRLEAIQIQGAINGQIGTTLERINAQALADSNARATYEAYRIQKDATSAAAGVAFFNFTPLPETGQAFKVQ